MTSNINLDKLTDVFNGKFYEQISDGPSSELIRVIDYYGANISHAYKLIEHHAMMRYFNKDGVYLPRFTHKVRQRGRDWLVDNSYEVIVRDELGRPKIGKDNNPIKLPAYDYFIDVLFSAPVPLKNILVSSIKIDDSNGLFEE